MGSLSIYRAEAEDDTEALHHLLAQLLACGAAYKTVANKAAADELP